MQKLRVWHCPKKPGPLFRIDVSSVDEAKKLLLALVNYDQFLFDNSLKPGHHSISGLQESSNLDNDEWHEWCHVETGEDIWDVIQREERPEWITKLLEAVNRSGAKIVG